MKKKALVSAVFGPVMIVACVLLVVHGCGQTGGGGSAGIQSISFYSVGASTTPVFDPLASASAAISGGWGSGNTMYALYYTLREYVNSRDGGTIDRANLYRLLYDVETLFSAMTHQVVALPSAEVIAPPFDFGNNLAYSAALNNETEKMAAAMTQEGNVTKGIVSWIWTESSDGHKEYGVLEAVMDQSTKDITVDFVFSVDYTPGDTTCDYNNRTHISGNSDTHAFQFVQTLGNTGEAVTQLVGKGVSRGAGNYFLFKVQSSNGDGFGSPLYVVLSAEADEATLKNFDVSAEAYSSAASLPASVASYVNYVENTPFFAWSDLLVDLNDLNRGITGKQGTIYLNY
ncbi:MAG: hypothetical protein JW873_07140 [Candidatus Saganbacteria bacterium]|nr:hypothetical protein [Candidatus Saganbacteria bacterium]